MYLPYCIIFLRVSNVFYAIMTIVLYLPVLRDDFQVHPRNTEVAVGDTGVLQCHPPRGLPKPKVKWKKDGETVRISGHYELQGPGNLVIKDARHADSGIYVCIAENKAGERESSPARLLVRGKCSGCLFISVLICCFSGLFVCLPDDYLAKLL